MHHYHRLFGTRTLFAAVIAATAYPATAWSIPIFVPNFSFETPDVSNGGNSGATPTGYTFTGSVAGGALGEGGNLNARIVDPTTDKTNQNGAQFASLYIDNNDGNPNTASVGSGQLTSGILTQFAANTVYTLTVGISTNNPTSGLNFGAGLRANSASVASAFFGSPTLSSTSFTDLVVSLNTSTNPGLVGQDLRIELLANSTFDFGREGQFDNVRLDASPVVVVPEASSVALLSLGGFGILGAIQMRKRR